jgi:hypothetical protein
MSTSAVVAVALVTELVRLTDPPAETLVALNEVVDEKLCAGAGVDAGEDVGATVGAADPVGLGAPEGDGAAVKLGPLGAGVAVGSGDGAITTGKSTENVAADAFAA